MTMEKALVLVCEQDKGNPNKSRRRDVMIEHARVQVDHSALLYTFRIEH
jgi:hypothetical protein